MSAVYWNVMSLVVEALKPSAIRAYSSSFRRTCF